jgi:hypothetical protein
MVGVEIINHCKTSFVITSTCCTSSTISEYNLERKVAALSRSRDCVFRAAYTAGNIQSLPWYQANGILAE